MDKNKIIQRAISSEKKYCEGLFSSPNNSYYFLGVSLTAAKVKKKYSREELSVLDKTCAFDLAEVTHTNLGQTNIIKVSSFCGHKGLIWGYDICPIKKQKNSLIKEIIDSNGNKIPVRHMDYIEEAFYKLLGSLNKPRFPFLPGSHIPCAKKSIKTDEPTNIYAALAIGIPKDRDKHACLLMEDVGKIPVGKERNRTRQIIDDLINSVLQVGLNQKVEFSEIFIGGKVIEVEKGEVGCALVAAPYFILAQDACLDNKFENTFLEDWEKEVHDKFLYKGTVAKSHIRPKIPNFSKFPKRSDH